MRGVALHRFLASPNENNALDPTLLLGYLMAASNEERLSGKERKQMKVSNIKSFSVADGDGRQ